MLSITRALKYNIIEKELNKKFYALIDKKWFTLNSECNLNKTETAFKSDDLEIEEKAFLQTYKLRQLRQNQNENEDIKGYLSKHKNLNKSSLDPIHLTMLDKTKADRMASVILEKSKIKQQDPSKSHSIFLDLQPGVGLVAKSMIEKILNDKNINHKLTRFMLIESQNSYLAYSNELKRKYDKSLDIKVVRDRPFEFDYLYKLRNSSTNLLETIRKHHNDSPVNRLIVYGVVPWNRLGFLNKLFSDYASDRCLFKLDQNSEILPEFYLYVPELTVAKLLSNSLDKFKPFISPVTVYSAQFLDKIEIVDEQTSENFYPFPMKSKLYNQNRYKLLNLNKMYLVNLKFKSNFIISSQQQDVSDKYLFYKFVEELFKKEKYSLIKVLKDIFSIGKMSTDYKLKSNRMQDHDLILEMCKHLGINAYSAIKNINILSFYKILKMIIENPKIKSYLDYLMLNNYDIVDENLQSPTKKRANELNDLISMNKSVSGLVRIPKSK